MDGLVRRSDRMPRLWTEFFRWPEWMSAFDERVRIEEYTDGETLVVRAELPGIDPDEDIDITVQEGALTIEAERREERAEEDKDAGRYFSEFRYGKISRTVSLPSGVDPDAITASYEDGILEVRVPRAVTPERAERKIAINRPES